MPLYFNSKDKNIQRIVKSCATLHESYKPPWWCLNPYINIIISLLKDSFSSYMKLERETIICPDGGKLICIIFKYCSNIFKKFNLNIDKFTSVLRIKLNSFCRRNQPRLGRWRCDKKTVRRCANIRNPSHHYWKLFGLSLLHVVCC